MTDNLPLPLTPADCDLRAFKDMPLEAATLRDARIVDVTTGDEFKAAVLLWAAAWHQVPAGSLPDDDVQLAKYAGYGRVVKEWLKVKTGALYGFIKCDDGRLYHRFLCWKALVSWDSRREHAWRKECDRIRKENKQRADQGEPALYFPPRPPKLATEQPSHSNGKWEISDGKAPVSIVTTDGIPAENPLKGNEGKGNEGNLPEGRQAAAPPEGSKKAKADLPDQWAEVFKKGRDVLGDNAGGTVAQLRQALGDNPNKVLGKLCDAATKEKPREWIYAFLVETAKPGTHVTGGRFP